MATAIKLYNITKFCVVRINALYSLSHYKWIEMRSDFLASTLSSQLPGPAVCCASSPRLLGSEVSLQRNLNCFKVKLSRFSPPLEKKEQPGATLALPLFFFF